MKDIKKILLLLFTFMIVNLANAQLIKGNERFEEYIPLLKGKKVAVVCNHTSVLNDKHLIDTLLETGINIQTIFTPEHGLKGKEQAGKLIDGVFYYKDTIKVISLYGKNKKPTTKQMQNIDIVLFDLQDVGCRFYTYISTLEYVMQSCIETSIPLIILDRPNPNNFVCGPVLKDNCKSFVGMHNIPICYGLTIGEYAYMLKGENWIEAECQTEVIVIPMLSYNRDSIYAFDIYPSPSLQSMQAIRNYPTLCLFEGTSISVGRGTNSPFEIIGFPNYKDKTMTFIPQIPPFKDSICGGEFVIIQSNNIELEYIIKMYEQYPQKKGFFSRYFDLLSGDTTLKNQIIEGKSADQIRQSWEKDLQDYKKIREKYILYK